MNQSSEKMEDNKYDESRIDQRGCTENRTLVGFGTFEVKERAAREGINPRTKEKIEIPSSKLPSFKAGKALKEIVSK